MKYRLRLSIRAKEDILSNARWWAKHRSAEQALRWHEGIQGAIEALKDFPARYPYAGEHGQSPGEFRELHYGLGRRATHRVVFSIEDDLVTVLTVRHLSQQDIEPGDL